MISFTICFLTKLNKYLGAGHDGLPAYWARRARHRFPEHQIPQPVRQEVASDGQRARLAEAEMAAGLMDHLHLSNKTNLASPFHFVLLQKLAWARVHGP